MAIIRHLVHGVHALNPDLWLWRRIPRLELSQVAVYDSGGQFALTGIRIFADATWAM